MERGKQRRTLWEESRIGGYKHELMASKTCMYICVHSYTCTHRHINVCLFICMRICTCTFFLKKPRSRHFRYNEYTCTPVLFLISFLKEKSGLLREVADSRVRAKQKSGLLREVADSRVRAKQRQNKYEKCCYSRKQKHKWWGFHKKNITTSKVPDMGNLTQKTIEYKHLNNKEFMNPNQWEIHKWGWREDSVLQLEGWVLLDKNGGTAGVAIWSFLQPSQ